MPQYIVEGTVIARMTIEATTPREAMQIWSDHLRSWNGTREQDQVCDDYGITFSAWQTRPEDSVTLFEHDPTGQLGSFPRVPCQIVVADLGSEKVVFAAVNSKGLPEEGLPRDDR